MILDLKPLNLAEVKELVKDLEDKSEILDYLKKFGKLSKDDAEKLSGELRALDNLKIKESHLVKVVDLLPTDNSSVNKIFNDVSLDEKEINEILEIVRRY
jgi:DNA-directed RNA polymerase subunit F